MVTFLFFFLPARGSSCPHGVRTTGEVFGRDDQYINRLTKVARGTSREISVKTL